jgi:hypothetical protein
MATPTTSAARPLWPTIGADIHVRATTLTYFDDTTARTPSVAKLARKWPLLFGQRFDVKAAIGFVRGAGTVGFGISRGMLWHGLGPTHALQDGASIPGASGWTVIQHVGPHRRQCRVLAQRLPHPALEGDAVITMRGAARFAPTRSMTRPRSRPLPACDRSRSNISYPATAVPGTRSTCGPPTRRCAVRINLRRLVTSTFRWT